MDEIPFAYAVPVTAGVMGPRIKDVLVFHQSTVFDGAAGNLAMDTMDAPLFNVAWHKIEAADFSANPMLNTPAGAPLLMHNHQINFNGENDGLNVVQNAIHIRDDGTVPAGTLAISMGFSLNPLDVRIRPAAAGGNFGFGAALINGNTIFHELGHKLSLRHCHNTTSQGIAAFVPAAFVLPPPPAAPVVADGLDFTRPGGGAPDGILDGVIRINYATYQRNTAPAGTTSVRGNARVPNPAGGFRIAEEIFVNNTAVGGILFFGAAAVPVNTDSYGLPRSEVFVFPSAPFGAGAFYSRVLFPDLLDWMDYWIGPVAGPPAVAGGPNQQQNLNERQIFVPPGGMPDPPAGAVAHSREIRCRTQP
jgi:hypothetical protein